MARCPPDHRGAALRVVGGRDHPRGFVEHVVHEAGTHAHDHAVDGDLVLVGVHPVAQGGEHAVDGAQHLHDARGREDRIGGVVVLDGDGGCRERVEPGRDLGLRRRGQTEDRDQRPHPEDGAETGEDGAGGPR